MCFFAIFLKNFNIEKACETKTFLIVHDVPRIFCDIRKKKEKKNRSVGVPSKKNSDQFWRREKWRFFLDFLIYHTNLSRKRN